MKETIALYTNNKFPHFGGGSSYIDGIIRHFSNFNFTVISNYCDNTPSQEQYAKNCIIKKFPKIKHSVFHRLLREIKCITEKNRYLESLSPKIVHYQGVRLYPTILGLARKIHLPIYKMIYYRRDNALLTIHNYLPAFTNDPITIDAYNHYIDQIDNIICVDKHIFDYCEKYCSEKNYKKNIWFLPNSVDTDLFKPCKEQHKIFRIGFAGRIASTVDIDILNQLIEKSDNKFLFHLAVSGDTAKIAKKNNVKVFSDLSQEEMAVFYNSVDILINPILHQAISRVTLEAMACEVPVMMYDYYIRSPHFSDDNGIQIEPRADDIIKKTLFYADNRDALAVIGKNARRVIADHYSIEVIMPQLEKIYNGLIS